MGADAAVELGRQAVFTALWLSAPILLVGMGIGFLVGLLQALTQIQDQTVSFVPKIVGMVLALAVTLPWLVRMMVEYSEQLMVNIPRLVLGGS